MQKKTAESLKKRLMGKARKEIKEKYSGKEGHVRRAIEAVRDLDECFNLLAEQCIEWYGMHFPELQRILRDNVAILKLVYFVGDRKDFGEKNIEENAGKENAEKVLKAARKSMGSDIEEPALKEMQLLALNALNLKEEREYLLKFVEKEVGEVAPNFSRVAGSVVAARLLSEAGSLRKLALMPSSTIQVLGAEKALFRHIKNKEAKPPKHGVIFMHPLIQKAGRDNRGKMARALAGKLSIAAKEDYFGKKDISKGLLEGLEKRFNELNKVKRLKKV